MSSELNDLGYVTGLVEKNEVGAEYEGIIYDRWLTLRVSSEQVIDLFDMDKLSTELQVGETCRVVIYANIFKHIRYFSQQPTSIEPTEWQGRIISIDWQPPSMEYRAAARNLEHWTNLVLVKTAVGDLVIDTARVKEPIAVGGFIVWQVIRGNCRFDLKAIV